MQEHQQRSEHERITAIEEQMTQVTAQLLSIREAINEIGQFVGGGAATGPIAAAPPVSFETLNHVMWTHGTSLQLSNDPPIDNLNVFRRREGTHIIVSPGTELFSVFFAIPTPAFVSGNTLRLRSVIIRFTTTSALVGINQVHINDGPTELAAHVGLHLSGSDRFESFGLPNRRLLTSGIGVEVRIGVNQGPPVPDPSGMQIIIHAIGAEFVFQPGFQL